MENCGKHVSHFPMAMDEISAEDKATVLRLFHGAVSLATLYRQDFFKRQLSLRRYAKIRDKFAEIVKILAFDDEIIISDNLKHEFRLWDGYVDSTKSICDDVISVYTLPFKGQ